MNFQFRCPKCRAINKLPGSYIDRGELRDMMEQDGFTLICDSCHEDINIRPNDVKAEESKLLGLIFILVFIPAIILGYYLFTGFSERSSFYLKSVAIFFSLAIPAAIYFTAVRAEQKRVRDFNKYKI